MKPHLSERAVSGCPCGRSHPSAGSSRKRTLRKPEQGLQEKLYDALLSKKAVRDDSTGRWHVLFSGSCETPVTVAANAGNTFATRYVRCRRCAECLHARRYYWGCAAIEQTRLAQEAGRRTWFGTMTFDGDGLSELALRAKAKHPDPNGDWWDHTKPVTYFCKKRKRKVTVDGYVCDERFRVTAREAYVEARRYWARLRKAGHKFKYFLVFERHKTGQVHMHFLLHEQDAPIRKALLQEQWPWGYTTMSIVGGRSKRSAAPEKAAWYVAKYLSKSVQSRQIASKGYRPKMRACRHSEGIRA